MAIIFTVPGLPPSGNHYVKHSRGRHYKTPEAVKFQQDMAILAAGRKIDAEFYAVQIHVKLGPKRKGDVDNFAKVVLDGLKLAGVIHSDAAVLFLTISKSRAGESSTYVCVGEYE
jgi:Holliday junction resolvase RusA-like endonuclease